MLSYNSSLSESDMKVFMTAILLALDAFFKEGKCLLLSVDTRILSQLEILVSALLDSIQAPYTFVVLSSQHSKPLRAASTWNKQKQFLYCRPQTGPSETRPERGQGWGRETRKKEAVKDLNQRILRPGTAQKRQTWIKCSFFLMRRQTGSQHFSHQRPGGQHLLCQTPFPWQHNCDQTNQRRQKGPWVSYQKDICRAAYQVHSARAGRAQKSPPGSWTRGLGDSRHSHPHMHAHTRTALFGSLQRDLKPEH